MALTVPVEEDYLLLMSARAWVRFPRPKAFIASLASAVCFAGIALAASADQVAVECRLQIARDESGLRLSWQLPLESGANLSLQGATNASGPWKAVTNAADPFVLAASQGNEQFFRADLALPPGSPDAAQIVQSVRAFAFASNPGLNPSAQFEIRIAPVRGLWDAMQIQIANVLGRSADGQVFNQFACVLRQDSVKAVGLSIGGHGLMSGLVRGDALYYTYSWGSGVHRSHVGKLRIVDGQLKFWDSGGLFDDLFLRDVFVSRRTDGEVALFVGRFQSFNQWQSAAEYGRLDESDPAAAKLLSLDGAVLATLVPTEY